jgi:hypothetical protein
MPIPDGYEATAKLHPRLLTERHDCACHGGRSQQMSGGHAPVSDQAGGQRKLVIVVSVPLTTGRKRLDDEANDCFGVYVESF